MPRRVVLHAGFHKTGTSTLQQFLRRNRKALMPVLAIRLKSQMKDLLHAARGYSTWRDPLTLAEVAHRCDNLLAGLPGMPRRTLVLSAEELSGHMPGRRALQDYGAVNDLADVYCDIIRSRFPKAEVMFYFTTRAPDTWIESAYWEHVKSSSLTLDFAQFAARYRGASDLAATVEALRAHVPAPVHTAPIESGDTIAPLLDLCEVPPGIRDTLRPVPPANARLPRDVLLELLDANRAYRDRAARKAAKQAILARVKDP